MLDDNDGVSSGNEGVESGKQLPNVVEVQACSRFVEDEDSRLVLLHPQIIGQLYTLVFATG